MENRRHGPMKGISSGLKIMAWIVLLVGLGVAVAAGIGAQQGAHVAAQRGSQTGMMGFAATGVAGAVVSAVMAVTWFLILYALADGLLLLLDIEVNTRSAATLPATSRAVVTEPVVPPAATVPAGPPARAPI